MKNYWGAHDDYEQEQIDISRRDAHENFLCEGLPFCEYCLDDRDLEGMIEHVNKELDKEKKRA